MATPDSHDSPPEEVVPFLYEEAMTLSPTSRDITGDEDEPSFEIVSALNGQQEPSAIKLRLYISHLLSTWNSRVFEFGSVLFLATIFPGTLLPASIYALVRAASAICLAPLVGRYVDRDDRLKVVRLSIGMLHRLTSQHCSLSTNPILQQPSRPKGSSDVIVSRILDSDNILLFDPSRVPTFAAGSLGYTRLRGETLLHYEPDFD